MTAGPLGVAVGLRFFQRTPAITVSLGTSLWIGSRSCRAIKAGQVAQF
jgi:hypothetical protein